MNYMLLKNDDKKISLRKVKSNEKDMRTLLKWLTDPLVLEYVYGEDAPWDLEKVIKEFGEEMEASSNVMAYFIVLDDLPVGYVQYYPIARDSYKFNDEETYHSVEGGYGIDMFIGEPDLWGRGIGTEAVNLLEQYLHEEQKVKILCVDPEKNNIRSVHFWKKVGFTPICYIKNYDDDTKESILMSKLLHDKRS